MAKIIGGITGFVTGKIAGSVGSTARTREGKVNTMKQYTIPANPNTSGQQLTRGVFARAVSIIRNWAATIYQSDWDRAVGQLPGFQSMQSVLMSNYDAFGIFGSPAPVNLGSLHAPDTITVATGGAAGEIDVTWSTELGVDGTDDDEAVLIAYATTPGVAVQQSKSVAAATRADGATGITFTGLTASATYIIGLYLRGAGTAAGYLTPCSFDQVAAHA